MTQLAVRPLGAEGATVAGDVVTWTAAEGGLDPPSVVSTTLSKYVVCGWSMGIIPLVIAPATLVVRTGAVELTGVAVSVDEMIAAGFTAGGVQATLNWSPD
jgi:hypothetical protein